MPQAKTIKQAKAAYKARNTDNPITEREQKQLQRSVQLDRRAWSLREREKTRADAVKKRAEREKKASEEGKRLGTQMRCDKFGYKSSQFHLGAFFGKAGVVKKDLMRKEEPRAVLEEQEGDDFEDVDDESLLKALDSPEADRKADANGLSNPETLTLQPTRSPTVRNMMLPPPRPAAIQQRDPSTSVDSNPITPTQKTAPVATTEVRCWPQLTCDCVIPADDFELHWNDFLSTSTQIARELNLDECEQPETTALLSKPEQEIDLRTTSFSSGFFDFTDEDLEELDPTRRPKPSPEAQDEITDDRAEISPPPLYNPRMFDRPPQHHGRVPAKHVRPHNLETNPGFTLTQLESFVDDDLQLTQI